MSREVDERIVKMEFQNENFQSNAEKTIKTLDELEQSLEFKSGISKSLDVVASNFTKMGAVAHRVIQNITDDVYNLGKNITKSFTVDQMFAGFNEYELKMGSTQTIMASTGESLDVVNQKLKELNEYSDKTIYSFRDMTSNIGKFTNAGVKLTPAVNAIKGVANLAAVSGANAEQASHAMYNFAQALSAGYVKLVDWKSIEIANMATVEFKEQLIDTALKLGTIRQEGNKYISTTKDMNGSVSKAFDATSAFNESLSAQWLTTDVLTATLENYASETTDIGKRANKAATELKTFTMVIGALKESAGSGWAQTMEIIFGNYDEAVELWTNLFHRIDGWLGTMADERNKVLNAWKMFGGRDMLIEGFDNILTISESISGILSKSTKELLAYNKGWRYLDDSMETIDIGPVGNVAYESLVKLTAGFRDLTKALKPSEKTLANISDIALGFVTIARDVWSTVSPIIGLTFKVLKILSPLLKIVIAVAGAIGRCIYVLSELRRKIFNLGPAAKSFNEFLDGIYDNVNSWADETVELIGNVPDALKRAMDNINGVDLPDLSDIGKSLMEGLTNAVENFKGKRTISSFFEGFFDTESIKDAGRKIGEICSNINAKISEFMSKVKMELKSSGPMGEFLVNTFEIIGNAAETVSNVTKDSMLSIGDAFGGASDKIKEFFKDFNVGQAIKLAQVISFIAVMLKFRKSLKSISDIAIEAKETLVALKKNLKSFAGAVKDIGKGVKLQLQAEAFKNIAFGIGVIVASIIALSAIDKDRLEDAVIIFLKITAIISLLVMVVHEFSNTTKKASKDISDSANTLSGSIGTAINTVAKGFSNSMMISALTGSVAALAALLGSITVMMVALSAIDSSKLRVRVKILKDVFAMLMELVAEIGIIMAAIVLIDKIPTKGDKSSNSIISSAIAIFALSNAISSLMWPIIAFSKIDSDKLKQGMIAVSIAVTAAMGALTAIAIISKKFPDVDKDLKAISKTLVAFSFSILSVIAPIFLLGSMDPKKLSAGLFALGVVIAELSVILVALGGAARIMGKDSGSLSKMAIAFGILAASVSVFALMAPMIMSNVDAIKEAIGVLIKAIANSITNSAQDIISCALDLVDVVLNNIDKYLPTILEYLGKVLDSVLDWLEKSLPGYMSKIAKIMGDSLTAFSKTAKETMNLEDLLLLSGTIVAVIIMINQITKMSDKIKEATPSLLILSGILVVFGIIINEIVKNSTDSASAISAAASLTICMYTMIELSKKLPELSNSMKKVKMGRIIKMVMSFGLMALGIVAVFDIMHDEKLNPNDVIAYGAGLGAVMFALAKLMQTMSAAQNSMKKFKLKDLGSIAIILLEIGLISQIVVATFKKLASAGISWDAMLAYSAGMSAVILSLTVMVRAMSAASRESRRRPDVKSLVASCVQLGIVVGAVGGAFAIMANLEVDPIQMLKYAAVMSLVFLSLTPLMKALGEAEEAGSKMKRWRQFLGQAIELAAIFAGVLVMFKVIHSSEIPPFNMIGYAASMSLVFLAMVPMLKALGQMTESAKDTKNFGQFGGLAVDIIAIMGSLLTVFALLDRWGVDPKNMVYRAIALGIAFAALNPMLQGLGKAAEGAKETTSLGSFLGILIDVGGIILALGTVFWALDKLDVDPVNMANYAIGLSIAFLGLSPLFLAIGLASKWGGSNVKAAPLLALSVVIAAIGVVIGGLMAAMVALKADPATVMEFAKAFSTMFLALTPIIIAVGLLSALFSYIKVDPVTMLTGGLVVVAVIGAAILVMTLIMGLLGLLNSKIDVAGSIKSGNEILVALAEGLSQFVGTLVGGGIGTGLGSFAKSAQPFIDMVSNLPDDFGDKLGDLAGGLLVLSGAAFIEQLGNLFNLFSKDKDSSLEKLGEDLNEFAPEMVKLSKSLEEITPEQAQVMKYAGEGLKAIIDAIPKEGGLFQNIFGTADIGKFATSLTSLGEGIANFATKVSGIKEEAVDHAVTCGKMAASLYDELPLTNGLFQNIFGTASLATFASELPKLGEGLVGFNDKVTSNGTSVLNSTSIGAAVDAAKSIASIYDVLEKTEGLWQWITGDISLGSFGENVGALGMGLGMFAQNTQGITSVSVEGPVAALKAIASMTSKGEGEKESLVEKATIKDKARREFFASMQGLSNGFIEVVNVLKSFKEVDDTPISSLNDVLNAMITIKGNLANAIISEEDAAAFESGADALADGIDAIIDTVKGLKDAETSIDSTSLVTKVEEMKRILYSKLSFNPLDQFSDEWQAGKNITLGFSNGMLDSYAIQDLKRSAKIMVDYAFEQIQKSADEHSPSKRAEKDGANLTKGYANGITKDLSPVKRSSQILVNEAFNSMKNALTKAYNMINNSDGFTPVIAPVVDLNNARRSVSELNNLFAGANANIGASAIPTNAIKITKGVKIETDAQRSSTDLTKVVDNVKRIGEKLTGMESKMESLKVVLDSGELVGGMTPKLMRAIKKQQVKIERGVIPSVVR